MTSTSSLTEDQEKFLKECEEELQDRYTENDKEFMEVFNSQIAEPPIIEDWGSRKPQYEYGNNSDYRRKRRWSRNEEHGSYSKRGKCNNYRY